MPESFSDPHFDRERHAEMLAQAQKLRGRIYVEEGAIEASELTPDGRHYMAADEESWHILALDSKGKVSGCARYLAHENTVPFARLGVRQSALARCDQWGQKLRSAVEQELQLARRRDIAYVEMGGWALREDVRCSTEAIRIAMCAYALARNLGGAIGVTAATVRHCSSSILRRIGGQALTAAGTELPSYHDPRYKCEMTILRFDSNRPNPRYEAWIERIREELLTAPAICATAPPAVWEGEPLHPNVWQESWRKLVSA
jgi:predicted GNAT family N-acyltransferase